MAMLELFAINIVAPTKENDYYNVVAVNQFPVIVMGRESDLHNALKTPELTKYVKDKFRTEELYKKARYSIMHCKRDNTHEKFELPVSEYTPIEF